MCRGSRNARTGHGPTRNVETRGSWRCDRAASRYLDGYFSSFFQARLIAGQVVRFVAHPAVNEDCGQNSQDPDHG